jgi:hypothetical protein
MHIYEICESDFSARLLLTKPVYTGLGIAAISLATKLSSRQFLMIFLKLMDRRILIEFPTTSQKPPQLSQSDNLGFALAYSPHYWGLSLGWYG